MTPDPKHAQSVLPAIAAGAITAAWFVWLSWKDSLLGINSDAAVYVLLAEHFTPWREAAVAFLGHLARTYPYPPLFPYALGLAGGGVAEPAVNYVFGAVALGVSSALIVGWYLRRGLSAPAALATVVVFALTPSTVFIAFGVFSESLYLALSFTALLVLAAPRPDRSAWLLAGALVGAAAVTRSAGITLVAAFGIAWWWGRRSHEDASTSSRAPALALALAAAPWLAWKLARVLAGGDAGYIGSVAHGGVGATLAAAFEQVQVNPVALAYHFHRSFDLLGNGYSAAVLGALALPALLSFGADLRRARPAAIYVAVYAAVLLVWPYPNHARRLMFPVLPLLLFWLVDGPGFALERAGLARYAKAARALALALLVLITLPSTGSIVMQIAQHEGSASAAHPRTAQWYGRDSQAESRADIALTERVFTFMRDAAAHVPPGACVTSIMPEFVQLYTGRVARRPPGDEASDATLHAALAACPWVMMMHITMFPTVSDAEYYPLHRVGRALELVRHEPVDADAPDGHRLMLAHYRAPARGGG